MRVLIFSILFLCSLPLLGQTREDSLNQVWLRKEGKSSERLDAALTLSVEFYSKTNPQKALSTLSSAISLAEETKNYESAIQCLESKGSIERNTGQLEASITSLRKAEKLCLRINDSTKLINIYINQSTILESQGNIIGSIDLLNKSLELSRKHNYQLGTARAINSLAIIYWEIKDVEASRKHYLEALDLNAQKIKGTAFQGLGLIFEHQEKYDSAFVMYNRAIEEFDKAGQYPGVISSYCSLVEAKNLEITDSIKYAHQVQSSILPSQEKLQSLLPEHFLLYQPRDIVGGDFYFLENTSDGIVFAVADCTGHGVPGAIVSIICHNALNRAVKDEGITDPGAILNYTKNIVSDKFTESGNSLNDGMDIAFCRLQGSTLFYAGANIPLWVSRKDEMKVFHANKQPIGNYPKNEAYVTHQIELQPSDVVYLFSDGYQDQFGGERNKKYGRKRMRELFTSIRDLSAADQKKHVFEAHLNWKGTQEQVDDVCVVGMKTTSTKQSFG